MKKSKVQWLLIIPFIGMAGLVPFANRIEPYVLGLSFLLFWIALWMVLSSVVMFIIYRVEYRNNKGDPS